MDGSNLPPGRKSTSMSKEIYISSTPHETRLAIVENDNLTEIYYERENEYTLAGSIYNGKVTRVLPGMQSSFVDIGLDRDAFLYITDFMEEAGDAADFEGGQAGESRRSPRDGAREPGRDNGRGEPRSAREPRVAEPSDADLFADAVSSLEPARPASPDSDRGDRDRNRRGGRNRRDRSGANPDSNPRRGERSASPERTSAPIERPAPPADMVSAVDLSATEGAQELGEGAPGADGSRRWRGRRGRRGGRSAESPRTAEQAASAPDRGAQPLTPPSDLESEGATFHGAPEPGLTLHGSAEARSSHNEQPAPQTDRQLSRVPRGFAPTTNLYQVESSPYGTESEAPAAEPLILPGEFLSKYRPGNTTPEPASSAFVAAPPPVSNFVVTGWDGGMVLPGETIRPRSPRTDSSPDSPRDFGNRSDRGRSTGRDRNRGERGDRPFREDRPSPPISTPRVETPVPSSFRPAHEYALPSAPDETSQASEPTYLTEPEHVPASHLITPLNTTLVPPPPRPGEWPTPMAAQPEVIERITPEEDFEPTEASASFRIDPVAPSEYRQPAPALEESAEAALTTPVSFAEADPVPELSDTPEAEVLPEWTIPFTQQVESSPATFEQDWIEDLPETYAPLEHDVTSIQASGEMQSEPFSLMTQDLVAPSPSAQGEPQSMMPVAADAVAGDQTVPAPYFAPGDGLLEEEELLDEEELPSEPLLSIQAGAGHHEEDALEGTADLSMILRERSIDEITGIRSVEMESDDFEEDFLEVDQTYDGEEDEQNEEDFDPEPSEEGEAIGTETSEELEESPYGSFRDPEAAVDSAETFARPATPAETREPRRDDRGREDRSRRDGRRGDRSRRSGGASDRGRREGGGSGHRSSAQATNLPAISELLKPGQEILCQIAKEPIAKKGARITSHIALPGRFLVFMPTVHHTGVSRKIESDTERRRLREILLSEKGEAAGGFIVRTAAAGASEEELRSDLRFLLNLWADIKARSESSKSPALIYHDLNLVERVLRDQVTDTFSAIWVDTETEYERVLRFLQRFQPSLIRRVKLYTKDTPLYEQFGITEEINKALRSKVWLKSGGSIVINQTEALVAIDINTGKFVGKTARLEDTIVKTNLDAIPEIVRQIRLRDLGGIIIIDFIDMDERKNRNKVMAALEDELKTDRAPSKILPFNDFGLVAITRKRVKQSLERTLSATCGVCAGTGMTKSPVTICNDIYVEMRKMHKHLDRGDVMLRVHPEVVKQLKSTTSHWLQEMEEMVGKTILVKSDPSLHPEQFDIH